jgi:hypothetical protein
MSVRRFIDSLPRYVPFWLSPRPTFTTGFKILWTASLFCDVAMQAVLEGIRASLPGVDARTDNVSRISYNRGLVIGETETVPDFWSRCLKWKETWTHAGSDLALAMRLHEYIAGNPQVRVITRSGRFTTVMADGAISFAHGTWNWDGSTTPSRASCWWDCWVVVYPVAAQQSAGYYVPVTTTWASGKIPSVLGFGLSNTTTEADTIVGLIATWKGQGVNVRTLVFSQGADYYAPTPIAGSPDGTWGKSFKQSDSTVSRNQTDNFVDLGTEYASEFAP